ncbi:MAG TPA: hypothetical protein DCX06_14345 [Opitutae bacterium]|nr:hypothetical protein [Opitutae bacterium]
MKKAKTVYTDPRKAWEKAEKRFDKMSSTQKGKTLVTAGILKKDYSAMPHYAGVLSTVNQ